MTPLFKSGDPLDPLNYRPISVLNSVNKIFERLLLHRLDDFACISNIKTKSQFGFTSNCGVNDALINLLGFIRNAIQCNNHCITVFCDFSKAFDTLDHSRLLIKLSRYGIRGTALNLILSYLSNRLQSVVINGVLSDSLPISYGVPQGSILGPWLFNIYVNDLAHYIHNPAPVQYADDTTLMAENSNFDTLFNQMQSTLNLFNKWSLANFLSLNSNKTKYIFFPSSKVFGPQPALSINNDYLFPVDTFKFLGIYVDQNLNFKEHIRQVRLKLSRLAGLSYAIGPTMSLAAARSFYFALVHSVLLYGILFYGSTFSSDLAPLQVLQNRILRNLFNNKITYNATTDLYKQLEILKIKDLHCFESCKTVFKSIKLNLFLPLQQHLNSLAWTHSYRTRGIDEFRIPLALRTRDKHDFLFQCVQHWNGLPLHIRNLQSFNIFKKTLLAKFLSAY